MNYARQLQARIQTMPPVLLFLLRIGLGLMLFIKGVGFISHFQELENIIDASHFEAGSLFLAYYVGYAHLLGGLFILMGLFTRFFAFIQLPILIGAVFFINAPHSAFNVQTGELGFSIVVLLLLIFFAIEGSGPYSVGRFARSHAL
jgi:uncharacterized membrane protein YphA (DoxX/SURF4 family)